MKNLFLTTALFTLMMFNPAQSMETVKCDDATMTKMQSDIDAMTDSAMKTNRDIATKQMDMAKTSMKNNKLEDCSMQLGMASMSMKMKCDDASMAMMKTEVDAITDPAMKTEVMKHIDLAQASMKDKKTDECVTHMGEAMGAMQKKM
jgi:hypothetical protein